MTHEGVPQYLIDAGFDTMSRLGRVQLDHSLLTVLVERWRPETHTFHLHHGEMTVTLMDVAIISGLRVDGRIVCTYLGRDWRHECFATFGVIPTDLENQGYVKLKWLRETFFHVPEHATEFQIVATACVWILYHLGCSVLANKTGNKVHLKYLSFIQNFHTCSEYAWETAALARLYVSLDDATKIHCNQLSGFFTLLQV